MTTAVATNNCSLKAGFPVESHQDAKNSTSYRHLHRLLSPGPELELHDIHSTARTEVEHYVAKQFANVYGANVKDYLPQLLSLRCNNMLSAVTGFCPAASSPLFVEHYLDIPVEDEIQHLSSRPVNRSSIVEIGNLAASQRGASQLLFILLASILYEADFEWLVFTATPQVQKSIGRLGLEMHQITKASPASLSSSELQDWGSYYETTPMVVAGRLEEASHIIKNNRVLRGMLNLYKNRVETLAGLTRDQIIHLQMPPYDQYSYAA